MIRWIHDPIYGHDPMLAVGATDKQIIANFRARGYKPDKQFVEMIPMAGDGRTVIDLEDGMRLLRLKRLDPKNASDVGTLAHEATHLAVGLFERLKANVSLETEETFAYYVGFLVREALWLVRRKRA